MLHPFRWLGCLLLVLAVLGTTVGTVAAMEVQACFSSSSQPALAITDDPANPVTCLNQVNAMSAAVAIDYVGTTAVAQPLLITKAVDATSPKLFLTAARGQFLPTLLVVFFDGNSTRRGNRLLSMLLTAAQIKEFSQSAQDQKTGAPTETVSFIYRTLQMHDDVNNTSSCWDFVQNLPC